MSENTYCWNGCFRISFENACLVIHCSTNQNIRFWNSVQHGNLDRSELHNDQARLKCLKQRSKSDVLERIVHACTIIHYTYICRPRRINNLEADLDQVFSHERSSSRWRSPFGVVLGRRASLCSSLPAQPRPCSRRLPARADVVVFFQNLRRVYSNVLTDIHLRYVICRNGWCKRRLHSLRKRGRGFNARSLNTGVSSPVINHCYSVVVFRRRTTTFKPLKHYRQRYALEKERYPRFDIKL